MSRQSIKHHFGRETCRTLSGTLSAIILLTVNVILVGDALAQTPPFLWAKAVGGVNIDSGRAIALDGSGNSYITGYFDSTNATFGTTTLSNSAGDGSDEIFVAKYDRDGNVLWAKSAGGIHYDKGAGIAVDSGGNCYVTGSFQGPASFSGIILTNDAGMFLAKYDGSGNLIWISVAAGVEYASVTGGSGVALAGDNCYVTGGVFGNAFTFFGTTNSISVTNNDGSDASFVAEYDRDGNVVWVNLAVRAASRSIAADAGGNTYITGGFTYSSVFDSITLTNFDMSGFQDMFVAMYNSTGSVVWAKSAGGANADIGDAIATDGAGCWVTGDFASPSIVIGGTALTNNNNDGFHNDVSVARYDNAGDVVWAKSAGGTGYDTPAAITTDGMGNGYVSGICTVPATFGSFTLTNGGLFTVKYSSAGTVLWAKAGSGNGNAIAADALGNCYLAGHCFNGATFDNITLTTSSSSYADVLVAKLGFPPMKVRRNGNQLTFTWTTNVTGFALESVTNSPAGTNWTAVTNTPVRVGDQFTVTNSISGTNKFYRLRK